MYKIYDYKIDREFFVSLWKRHGHSINKLGPFNKVSADLTVYPEIVNLFNYFGITPILKDNCDLILMNQPIGLHNNIRNNGLIIFPILGSIHFDFYSYKPTTIIEGRPVLEAKQYPQEFLKEVESTHIQSIFINKPTAINGNYVYKFKPDGECLFFILKIPLSMGWNDINLD